MRYAGTCRGGPFDGDNIAFNQKRYDVAFRPKTSLRVLMEAPLLPLKVQRGYYSFVLGQWIWHEEKN